MSTAMHALYQQVILDHSKYPHGKDATRLGAQTSDPVGQSHQVNPTCGDEVTLRVELDPARTRVTAVAWDGAGCSISQASISILTDLVTDATLAEVGRIAATFRALMQTRGAGLDDEAEELLGDAAALTGVSQYPARIKCAMLGWSALQDAMIKAGAPIQMEDA